MMDDESTSTYTEQLNIRVTVKEKQALEARAQKAGIPVGKWCRRRLVEALGPSQEERRRLMLLAMGNEINRLTLLALYASEDISTAEAQERIERLARDSAEAIVDRWLALAGQKKGAA